MARPLNGARPRRHTPDFLYDLDVDAEAAYLARFEDMPVTPHTDDDGTPLGDPDGDPESWPGWTDAWLWLPAEELD